MTPKHSNVTIRVVHEHTCDCEARAKRAKWGSPWWFNGETTYGDAAGRATRNGRRLFLVARCVFDADCKGEARVDALALADHILGMNAKSQRGRR